VLVHGMFGDHRLNWDSVKASLAEQYGCRAVARRGRGGTTVSKGHRVGDEGQDVAAVIRSIGEPVFLLGHSYGATVALAAAAIVPDLIRKLILYEAPWPGITSQDVDRLEGIAQVGDFEKLVVTFYHEYLGVPMEEVTALRETELWPRMVADAEATVQDLRAMSVHEFDPESCRELSFPVLLQVGTESPRSAYVTDALAAVLPDVRIDELAGQGHDAVLLAPHQYMQSVARFLS
jgi:pimeloyl-ACP methyl ester carboxylesterase